MKLGIVSTFSNDKYEEYAKYFVESMVENLSRDISVFLYLDEPIKGLPPNVKTFDFHGTVPELVEFKKRNQHRTFNDFIYDGIRFSHKVYAICHAAKNSGVDRLIWLDADTVFLQPITPNYLNQFLPLGFFTSYLGRPGKYSECGWIAFDLTNKHAEEFFNIFQNYYDSDDLYTLDGFTDCHAYDATRIGLVREGKIKAHNLTTEYNKHPFNAAFALHLYHLKGTRKFKREKLIGKAKAKLELIKGIKG